MNIPWASKILENMYLGSGSQASNLSKLQEHGITHILNVADDVQNYFPGQFQYLNLNVADFGQDKGIRRVFDSAIEFHRELAQGENNKVLIHCAAGANRSVTVTIAILMAINNWTLKEAWEHVAERRIGASPLRDNIEQLIRYEFELYEKNTIRDHFDFFEVKAVIKKKLNHQGPYLNII